ncbi:MAG TPA: pantoate--beta-alanine ligase [Paludibacteraceae bacterium]|mgnify:CR=1 FL=1|nr:pantoate--beta-alanine ligase [Paludibacteraceae bacterium]HRS67358.1 pantoate--beta-alanine ligase [Paludibacteraceae bacterium]
MQIITTKNALLEAVSTAKLQDKTIGFVPTMGALHDGHLTLVKRCVSENDLCFVSVFVNPTQFNDKNDLANYPRTVEADAALLESVGCKVMFVPNADEMYNADEMQKPFEFDFGGLDQVMEGRFRPGHFNGVVQVVSKLFKLVQPTRAYFGEKDFQQLAIIRRMVSVMKFPIEIVGCPIVREASGLALSSRNSLLTSEQRQRAVHISQVLKESQIFALETSVQELHDAVVAAINAREGLDVEYFEIVDGKTLQSIKKWEETDDVVGCITVYCGKIRLIDNIRYK